MGMIWNSSQLRIWDLGFRIGERHLSSGRSAQWPTLRVASYALRVARCEMRVAGVWSLVGTVADPADHL